MYTVRFTFYPAVFMAPMVIGILKERTEAFHAGGFQASLLRSIYAPDSLVYGLLHFKNLAALESFRNEPPELQRHAAEVMNGHLTGLLERPTRAELLQELLAAPLPLERGAYVEQVRLTPLPGMELILAEKVAEFSQDQEKREVAIGACTEAAGAAASSVIISRVFTSLEEYEACRGAAVVTSGFRRRHEAFAGLISRPAEVELQEIIVASPLPKCYRNGCSRRNRT